MELLVSPLWIPAVISDLFVNDDTQDWLYALYYTFQKMFQKPDLWYLQPWVFVFFLSWISPSKQSQDIPQYPDISHLQKSQR